jgi:two-component system chemotaxis response regulator CheB
VLAKFDCEAVVIGASAGGIDALSAILPGLPANFPIPIIVVTHLPADRRSLITEVFQAKCSLTVKEVEDKEKPAGGTVYFAPPDYHVLVEPDGRLSLSSEEAVMYSRPSIDVLFESAADAFGEYLLAIVLSGANSDGTRGLRAVVDCGGTAIVQLPSTAFAAEMPEAALIRCPEASALAPLEILASLLSLGSGNQEGKQRSGTTRLAAVPVARGEN